MKPKEKSMKTLTFKSGIKQVLAWVAIVLVGMMMGGVVTAEAAPIAKQQTAEVSLVRTMGKGLWSTLKIRDIQENGQTPIVHFKF